MQRLILALALAASTLCAAQTPYGVISVPAVGQDRIVSLNVYWPTLAAALDMAQDQLDPAAVACCAEVANGLQRVPAQLSGFGEDYARITLLMPPSASATRVRLYGRGAPEGCLPVAGDVPAMSVRTEGTRVIVNNGFVEVVHDPAAQAGLPSRVAFLGNGQVLEGFAFNDRVYDKDRGAFYVRCDPEAKVRVVTGGPLEIIVEVQARYMRDGQAPESKPEALYTFAYRAGTPSILVRARCWQQSTLNWPELHVMEWNLQGQALPAWKGGTPVQSGAFEAKEESYSLTDWAGLSDGARFLGIAGDFVKLYSGSKGYGSYIHGPWVGWEASEQTLECALWIETEPGAADRLAAYAQHKARSPEPILSTSDIEAMRADLVGRLANAPVESATWCRWGCAIAQRQYLERDGLPRMREALAQLTRLASDGAGRDAILQALQVGSVQASEDLVATWQDGSLVSLYSLKQGREFIADPLQPIWHLTIEMAGGQAKAFTNRSTDFACALENSADVLTWKWQGHGAAEGLAVVLTSRATPGDIALTFHVDNTSANTIMDAAFPRFALGALGDSASDDAFFQPTVSGTVVPAPLEQGIHCRAEYPGGWGSLQFMAHYDGAGGLYLAAHDPTAATKTFRAEAGTNASTIQTEIFWPAPDASKPGNAFSHEGVVVLAAFEGDWYDASQRYRAWVEREAGWWPHRGEWARPDTPAWMKDICVWALANGTSEQVVGPVKRFAEFMGVPTAVHWYCWHEIPFDDNYPHYFPTKPGFAQGVAQLHEAGVRVMPYINGRLWDSDTDDFESLARPMATKDRDGSFYVEMYGSGQKLVPMCPTQQKWRDTISDVVLRLVGPECNVDGVYIDQIAAATPRLCYDATHGHPLAGGHWWTVDGYWPMMTALNKAIDEKFPDKMLTTECTGEPYTHLLDGYLSWHYQCQGAVPAVAAVYGGKIQLFGRNYGGGDQLAHRMKSAQALVFGEQLGWIGPGIVDEQPVTAEHLRRCARMRKALHAYLAEGHMARPPAIVGNVAEVTADWAWGGSSPVTASALQRGAWQAEDGSVAFIFANCKEQPLAFTWQFDATRYGFAEKPLSAERITESERVAIGAFERAGDHAITLAPLAVEAIIARAQ